MTDYATKMTPDEARQLGKNFKLYRKFRKVILRDLGKAIGLSINTIRQHEGGGRLLRADDIHNAARVLNIPVSRLMDLRQPKFVRVKRGAPLVIEPFDGEGDAIR